MSSSSCRQVGPDGGAVGDIVVLVVFLDQLFEAILLDLLLADLPVDLGQGLELGASGAGLYQQLLADFLALDVPQPVIGCLELIQVVLRATRDGSCPLRATPLLCSRLLVALRISSISDATSGSRLNSCSTCAEVACCRGP